MVAIQALCVLPSNSEVDESTFAAYDFGLSDIPIELIESGVKKALKQCKFRPTPAEMREFCGIMTASQRAIVAFESVKKAVASHGGYAAVVWDDPVITATIRSLGGWSHCCDQTEDDFKKWYRRDFLKTYETLCHSGVSAEMAEPLQGIRLDTPPEPALVISGLPAHPDIPLLQADQIQKRIESKSSDQSTTKFVADSISIESGHEK